MEVRCKKWADEKAGWEAMVSQHEDWLEELGAKWTSLLDAKDYDLLKLKSSYQELNYGATGNIFMSCSNSYKLKTVRIQLEMHAWDTPNLIEALQSPISVKEKQMGSARKELEAAPVLEAADVDQLKRQLSATEHEIELVNDMQEKEQRWQNEIDAITQELSDHQASARQKDKDTTTFRENLHILKEHQKTEDLKVTKLLASFKQENDALTNELDHLQKAGELENAGSQKGDRGLWLYMILKKITVNKDFQSKLYPMDHHSCLNLDGLHLQHHFHITSNVENINEL
ncbi:unnamed protein product [Sphagnum compactum]